MKETEKSRSDKIQRLLNKREEQLPNESFDSRFNAVMASDEGRELLAQMHLSNEEAVPVFGPQTAATVGLRYPEDRALFRERWLRKEGPIAGAPPSPAYPTEEQTRRRTAEAAGSIKDEPKLKEEGRRGFLDEVARQISLGHSYSEAWSISSSTSPGKELYAQWSRGAAQNKKGT